MQTSLLIDPFYPAIQADYVTDSMATHVITAEVSSIK